MTDILQKTENVAKNVANKNSQDLTEQWKKGELPSGEYYIIDALGLHTTDRYYPSHGFGTELPQSVLDRVPSYDELQNMNKAVNECMAANIKLVEQNAQLKDLLKECQNMIAFKHEVYEEDALIKQIDEALR